mgnify:CR=1 FL=1
MRPTATRRGIDIFAREGSPVVAVNDGVIKKIGTEARAQLLEAEGKLPDVVGALPLASVWQMAANDLLDTGAEAVVAAPSERVFGFLADLFPDPAAGDQLIVTGEAPILAQRGRSPR